MRYVQFEDPPDEQYTNKPQVLLIDRQIEDTLDLACVLEKANFNTWIEGIGQPRCYSDVTMWHLTGTALREFSRERTAEQGAYI